MISQDPGGGGTAAPGSTVTIVVATAPATTPVPNVVGDTSGAARSTIVSAGLTFASQTQVTTDPAQNGLVLSQDPKRGKVKKGSTVTVTIGKYTPTNTPSSSTASSTHELLVDHVQLIHRPGRDGMTEPRRVTVLGGGRSSEHEVSVRSAASVAGGLRQAGHTVTEIEIGRDGVWRRAGEPVLLTPGRGLGDAEVVFPVLHGPFGEDGTVQGLLECLDVPYVGAGVLASAACMDKIVFKELMAQAGLPQVGYRAVRETDHRHHPSGVLRALEPLGRPVFVKPARLGSSVGIVRVGPDDDLAGALDTAFTHDSLAIVEAAAVGREVECSVMGNDDPIASEPGEILLSAGEGGWYDYEAKYTPGGMELHVPARIGPKLIERVKELAIEAFLRAGCSGLARADFFVVGDEVLLNELNTMPGFTETSVFGSLFAASGVPYPELLDRLVGFALTRHAADRAHQF